MKKVIAILFTLVVMIVPCAIGASATEAINSNEQKVLDFLDQNVKLGTTTYHIPDEYINQAKNYFLTIEMTEKESNDIIAELQKGVNILKAAALPDKEFHMSVLPHSAKVAVLEAGKAACAVIDLTLVYNTSTEKVTITKSDSTGGQIVFDSAPIVKVTGSDMNLTAIAITVCSLIAVSAVTLIISKKVKLF